MDVKKVVLDLIGHPEELHFHCSRTLFFDGIVGNTGSSGIVAMNWSSWLWMAKFF
jgi:hypothetical protein